MTEILSLTACPQVLTDDLDPKYFRYSTDSYSARRVGSLLVSIYVYVYLFYTSYSYNSISRYAERGISAHIPRKLFPIHVT